MPTVDVGGRGTPELVVHLVTAAHTIHIRDVGGFVVVAGVGVSAARTIFAVYGVIAALAGESIGVPESIRIGTVGVMAICDRDTAHGDVVRRFVAFHTGREIMAILSSRVQGDIFQEDVAAVTANADRRLREAGAGDILQHRADMRCAPLVFKKALEIICAAVADRDPLVRLTGQVERLPCPLKIEVTEGQIIRAWPEKKNVSSEDPIPDVRHRLRISRERPSGAGSDEDRPHRCEPAVNSDDGHRRSDPTAIADADPDIGEWIRTGVRADVNRAAGTDGGDHVVELPDRRGVSPAITVCAAGRQRHDVADTGPGRGRLRDRVARGSFCPRSKRGETCNKQSAAGQDHRCNLYTRTAWTKVALLGGHQQHRMVGR
jgi:hypothetical protein